MTPYLEIGGDYHEIAPGVWLIELPLPFSLGLINVYLVRIESGYLLVDCGMESEACFEALDRAREGIGLEWDEVRHILLTHMHPDHMGLAPRLLDVTGARLHLHAADEKLLAEIAAVEDHRDWQRDTLARAGVKIEMIERIAGSMAEIHRTFMPLSADCRLAGGECFATAHGPLQVIWTPGHSPGHVCLYEPARRLLWSGDHILEHLSPNIGWQPGRDPLGEFLASLELIADLDIDLILPSHGAPFTGHREWVRKTQEHHAERCGNVLEALRAGPSTAAEIVQRIWTRPLSPFHYRFAVFEILAHLEYLRRRGEVSCETFDTVDH